jgi:hypothetical protein
LTIGGLPIVDLSIADWRLLIGDRYFGGLLIWQG